MAAALASPLAALNLDTRVTLWRERRNYSVHGSSCALNNTVADVLGSLYGALCHMFRCSHRSGFNRANGNGKCEHD